MHHDILYNYINFVIYIAINCW